MNNTYRTIYKYGEDEIIINKSRFIGYAKPIELEQEALDFIEEIKSKHKDATHNVYAYVYGKDNNIQRFSDDGEPSGTAGIPVLEVIKKEDLRNVVVVVTRYFGGTKLGTGGLIRAYTKGAKIGLESGIIIEKVLHHKLKIRIDYTLYGMIENYLMTKGYLIDEIVYDDQVNIYVYVKYSEFNFFKKQIVDLTSDNVIIEYIDKEYIPMKDGKRLK
ncbi:putative YigZ family protein [Keratinibaculum paraultunense]|uniref:Putative YigZ family protein n=1 Tax=Keratinibaculum paraultunense TaxID=1278232 RepID=A0A4V2UUJ7_9FIRM|nr:YigZ family protein [Keratinibaculum paraultunense]QQY80512.1 YigZ family protein [Keratinibaculum paraultunense]TCS91234.1 putative YigZ family protein [Keratinibaculum paraultunense]